MSSFRCQLRGTYRRNSDKAQGSRIVPSGREGFALCFGAFGKVRKLGDEVHLGGGHG